MNRLPILAMLVIYTAIGVVCGWCMSSGENLL